MIRMRKTTRVISVSVGLKENETGTVDYGDVIMQTRPCNLDLNKPHILYGDTGVCRGIYFLILFYLL